MSMGSDDQQGFEIRFLEQYVMPHYQVWGFSGEEGVARYDTREEAQELCNSLNDGIYPGFVFET